MLLTMVVLLLRAGRSETQALDRALSTWLQGPVSDELKSKRASLIKKHIVFCVDTGRPVLPADILAFFCYALWRRNARVRFHQNWMYYKFGVWPQTVHAAPPGGEAAQRRWPHLPLVAFDGRLYVHVRSCSNLTG